jgi:hypothetical protein
MGNAADHGMHRSVGLSLGSTIMINGSLLPSHDWEGKNEAMQTRPCHRRARSAVGATIHQIINGRGERHG